QLPGPVRQLLVQGHVTLDDADHLFTMRVHFPAGPALLEAEQADEPPLLEIVGVALAIGFVPVETGELGLGHGTRAEPQMDREIVERLALHNPSTILWMVPLPCKGRGGDHRIFSPSSRRR